MGLTSSRLSTHHVIFRFKSTRILARWHYHHQTSKPTQRSSTLEEELNGDGEDGEDGEDGGEGSEAADGWNDLLWEDEDDDSGMDTWRLWLGPDLRKAKAASGRAKAGPEHQDPTSTDYPYTPRPITLSSFLEDHGFGQP